MRPHGKLNMLFAAAIAVSMCAGLCACGNGSGSSAAEPAKKATADQATLYSSQEHRKLIIDTDTGADDASALLLAAKQPNVDILGITVLLGNVDLEQGTKNVLETLEQANCDAPVYKGSAETYDGTEKTAYSVFGNDGMGDADLIHPEKQAAEGDAVDFIIDTVKADPGEVEIVMLGPATNIAKAIKKDPDAMKKVKRIWSMGTCGLGAGNASPVAEFNVYADAPAYKIMLDSGLPITVIGLDVCDGEAEWTDEGFAELEAKGKTGEFVAKSFGKIREFYRGNGIKTVMNCDSLAMMCVLFPDFIKSTINTHASCIVDVGETYAEVLFYKEGFTYDSADYDFDYNVVLVTEVDKAAFFDNYKSVL